MTPRHRLARCLGSLMTLCLAAPMAAAQTTAINGGSPSSISVNVTVRASVAPACGFSPGAVPSGTKALGNITQPFSTDFSFALRCNVPARVAVVSDNGGLRMAGSGSPPAGYAVLAGYDVTLNLAGDQGAPASASCDVATLAAAAQTACSFRGPAGATAGLRLGSVSTDTPGSYLRVAGPRSLGANLLLASTNYSDRLTITVSPAS